VKPPAVVVPDRDAGAHRETRGGLDGDLLLAEVAIQGQGGDRRVGLPKDRLPLLSADRHVGAEVERVTHEVLALADLDDASTQGRNVIDGRLKRPVIGPDQVGVAATDADGRPLAHLRVHGVGQLTLLRPRGEIIAQGDPPANAEDRHDLGDGPCRGDERVTGHREPPRVSESTQGEPGRGPGVLPGMDSDWDIPGEYTILNPDDGPGGSCRETGGSQSEAGGTPALLSQGQALPSGAGLAR